MAESVGEIGLDLVVNQNGFNKQLQGITGLAKKAGATIAAAFAVKKLVDFSKQCIELGSDLAEVQNVVDVTFTTMSKKVDEFAKSAAFSFGLSETMAKKYTGTLGAMAKAFGFSESAAYEMSTTLTGLAGDVASFYNITQDEAYTKLKSVFTGETESLKDLGVVMTQSALDAYALANGFGKTIAKMSEAEKVALRYAFVQNQLATASGDFARTSGGWANQVRLLSLQFDSLKASIGQGLINAFLPVIKVMNVLLGKIQSVATAFANLTAKVFGKAQSSASGVAETVGDVGTAISDTTSDAVSGVGDSAKAATEAAKKTKSAATSIDELNIVSDDSSDSSGGGGTGSGVGGAIGSGLEEVPGAVEEEIETPMEKALTRIQKLVNDIGKSFTEGFTSRFEKINFQPLLSGLDSIKESFNNIFTDVDVTNAARDFVMQLSSNIGGNLANFISIGNSIATNLVVGLANYLQNNTDFIKERFVSMFNSGTSFLQIQMEFNDFLTELFTIITGDAGIQITESIISVFSNSLLAIGDLFLRFSTDYASMVINPILENKADIEEAIISTLDPVAKVCKTIADAINDTWGKVFEVYDTYVKPAFDNFSSGISKIVKAVLDAYNNNFAPVFNNLADKFNTLVSEHLQPLIDKFVEFAGKVVWAISEIWDKTLSPFIAWFIANVIPSIAPVIDTLGTIIMNLYTIISEMISSTINILLNIIDFIVAVFTGNWEAAWTAIKDIIASIFDAIKNVVFTTWTAIQDNITTVINAIKTVITTVFNAIKTFISTILNAIKTLFSSIWNGIKTTVTNVVTGLKSSVISIIDAMKTGISTALGNIKSKFVTVFTTIKDTVSGILTGLWNNIKGVINSILSGIEKMANGVIKGINSVINALNNLSFDLPDWLPGDLGGKSLGFNIPSLSTITIPKLAQGGYVKANTPQLAMIGDNRHQGEVVAPEDKLLEMALKAVELSKDDSNGSNELLRLILEMLKEILAAILGIEVTAEVDGRTLLTMIRNEEARGGYSMSR
ncbi:Phage-related protein [Anaerosporobacter mobilis DSM 15930]|uniref:Phage-related protein n=1 Tax=Anaerosporobacter mobilis DSM 15930 TaxID=1120996 RepID=A0A1M7MWP1_9FIRM|nr:hypothetical protein [Anaerosporobacter mobilis]SHM95485.1 Phage-related protein [Anaerosporobacter mobilis DSM 15930]